MVPFEAAGADEDQLDLRAYIAVLRRRWKLIVGVVGVCVTLALALSLTQSPKYRAESELLVRQSESATIIGNSPLVNANEAERRLNNEVRLFESGLLRDKVDALYDGPLDVDDVGASVSSKTSDVLEASVTAEDPEDAAQLVNLYADTFLEVRRQQRTNELLAVGEEIRAKIDELDAQIAQVRAPLTAAEAELADNPGSEELQRDVDRLTTELLTELTPMQNQRGFYMSQIEDVELSADITSSSGAQVLTVAETPTSPVSPAPKRDGALALVLGSVLGVGLAFLFDNLDNRIRGVADLEDLSGGLPMLALIPFVDKGHAEDFVATRDEARGPQAEAFRSLRTAVKFASLDRPIKVLQVTSGSQSEGKTTTVANLAIAMAQGGDRVAVICCDLRRPRVQERFGMDLTPGLTDVLVGDATLTDALRHYDDNVMILPAGSHPPNPSELLSSSKATAVIQALAEEFDLVILDSTPVLPVTDALVVSRLADATLIVVDGRSTARTAVRRTLQLLSQVNAPILGLVLNGLPSASGYGYGYGYGYGPAS